MTLRLLFLISGLLATWGAAWLLLHPRLGIPCLATGVLGLRVLAWRVPERHPQRIIWRDTRAEKRSATQG